MLYMGDLVLYRDVLSDEPRWKGIQKRQVPPCFSFLQPYILVMPTAMVCTFSPNEQAELPKQTSQNAEMVKRPDLGRHSESPDDKGSCDCSQSHGHWLTVHKASSISARAQKVSVPIVFVSWKCSSDPGGAGGCHILSRGSIPKPTIQQEL